jgi:hypothetical protein
MPEQATLSLDSLKRDAARLLKQARAGDPAALRRFASLRNPPETLQLKHALAVVADEAGFDGWTELKQAQSGLDFSEFFAGPSLRDSLNPWFNNYEEARAFHAAHGGVLLPYRHHFFVSSLAMLERLGFEADHPDWADIGFDFVRPRSEAAYGRIRASLQRRFGQR